jgi:hypothetical protein
MKKVQIAATFVTIYLVFFQSAPYVDIPADIIVTMFFLSPFLVIGMVYTVLKYGEPSKDTFEEKFYDDFDYKRNGKEELTMQENQF